MIYFDYQNTDAFDYDVLQEAIKYGVSSASPIVEQFEKAMADYLRGSSENVMATNSGTSALHLALIGADIGETDRVLMPVITFVSTANVIKYVGAKPVFCDVDPKTWIMNPESRCNDRFEIIALLPVDLYGNPCAFTPSFKESFGNSIIVDATESLGAKNNYAKGHYTCYSFNGNKVMTTGAGGLLVGDSKEIERLKKLSTQAKNPDGTHFAVGYNYRMAGVNAALGLSQLRRLPEFLERKRKINSIYRQELSGLLQFQEATPGTQPSWWMTAALWPKGTDIEKVQRQLAENGVPTRRIFRPLNQSEPFKDGREYPVAEDIYARGLCLPSSTLNRGREIYKVCGIIRNLF